MPDVHRGKLTRGQLHVEFVGGPLPYLRVGEGETERYVGAVMNPRALVSWVERHLKKNRAALKKEG